MDLKATLNSPVNLLVLRLTVKCNHSYSRNITFQNNGLIKFGHIAVL